jgi:hypothetical protein
MYFERRTEDSWACVEGVGQNLRQTLVMLGVVMLVSRLTIRVAAEGGRSQFLDDRSNRGPL